MAGRQLSWEFRVPKWISRPALAILAAALAYGAVMLEGPLRSWAHGRPMLPLIMLLVGTALLNPRLRNQVIVAMCFGVAFLAIRDSFHTHLWDVPFTMDRDLANTLILSALLLIAALCIVAAILETLNPGGVWARRLYFFAAALYCNGLGIRYYGAHGSLQTIVLCGTGLMAVIACLYAHRIVAPDSAAPVRHSITDEAEQRLRDAEHLRALRDKEWQDPLEIQQDSSIASHTS